MSKAPATINAAAGRPFTLTAMPSYVQRLLDDQATAILAWWARGVLKTRAMARRAVLDRLTGRCRLDAIYTTTKEDNGVEFLNGVKQDLLLAGHVSEVIWGTEEIDGLEVRVGYVEFPAVRGVKPKAKYIASSAPAFRGMRGDVIIDEFDFVSDLADIMQASAGCRSTGGRLFMLTSGITEGSVADKVLEMGRRAAGLEDAGPVRPGDMPVSLHTVTIDDAIEAGVVEYLQHVTGMTLDREGWRQHCRSSYLTESMWLEETGCIKRKRSESMYLPPTLTERLQRDDDGGVVSSGPGLLAVVAESVKRLQPSELAAGWDVARKKHLSVLWVWGKCGTRWRTMGVLVMKDVRFDEQQRALRMLMDADFGAGRAAMRVKRVCIDAIGMGSPLAEEAETRYRTRAEGVTLTTSLRNVIMPLMRKHLECETLSLPVSPEIIQDFALIRSVVMPGGALRFEADESDASHADFAWAAAMGLHAAESKVSRFQPVRMAGGCRG